jgi:hypothetical protein
MVPYLCRQILSGMLVFCSCSQESQHQLRLARDPSPPDLHSPKGCADPDVLSTKSKCQFLLNHDMHYKEVCTATDQYKWFHTMLE